GSDLDEILAYRRFNGTSWEDYHILHGGQDTAAKLVNQSGQVVEQYEYDPFGKATVYTAAGALVDVGPAGTSPEDGTRSAYGLTHLYKAMRLDPETGNCYVRNRFYDPRTGRFMSRDPIGVWGDGGNMGNEYAYAWNRPELGSDPLGLLLVVIDGSDSARDVKMQPDGRYNSHSRNFYEDYLLGPDESKAYWDGPGTWGTDADNIFAGVLDWVKGELCKNPNQPINIVGHSRGGMIAIEVARALKSVDICGRTGFLVNFLGVLDPVDSTPTQDFPDPSEKISDNVNIAVAVYGNPDLGSRWYFNTVDGGVVDPSKTLFIPSSLLATHAAIGGDPWGGDHPTYPPNMTEGDTGYYTKYKDWKNVHGTNAKFGRDDDVVGSKLSNLILTGYAVGLGGIRLRGLTR
ncbi:MAG: RHS repeat-associated core domain-containing protein, partial [Planctomycetota bacterium]